MYISEQYGSPSLKCGGKEGKERKLVRVGKRGWCVCVCVCVKGRQCKKGSVWGCRENYMYILNQIKAGQLLKQQPHVYIGRCTI